MTSMPALARVRVAVDSDIPGIVGLSSRVYPSCAAWSLAQLSSRQRVFKRGQFVAVSPTGQIVGYAASLIVFWNDYDRFDDWTVFTNHGTFSNHDPQRGMTLYGAEVMVDPSLQGMGIGKMLYAARRDLCVAMKLKRIRAGGRLRGYSRFSAEMSAVDYVKAVIVGRLRDATLSFQLKQGFDVLAVVPGYLRNDPESLGWAALIEWINREQIRPEDLAGRDPQFARGAG